MSHPYFERFHKRIHMIEAEIELIALGEDAIPILETLFNGEARNDEGVPYRNFGLPLRCAMEVVARMGATAKPLERFLRLEVAKGDHVAAMCLRGMGSLEENTILVLANALRRSFELSGEAACTLINNDAGHHPAVALVLAESEKARREFERAGRFLKSRNTYGPK